MAFSSELDRLKAEHDEAFQAKQAAFHEQEAAWHRCTPKKQAKDEAYKRKSDCLERVQRTGARYDEIRDTNQPLIDQLNHDRGQADRDMKSCSRAARRASRSGDHIAAKQLAAEGRMYRKLWRTQTNQYKKLIGEIKSAWLEYKSAGNDYRDADEDYQRKLEDFRQARDEHQAKLMNFSQATQQFDHANNLRKSELERVRQAKADFRAWKREVATIAGIPEQYRDNVWLRDEPQGRISIYFGGEGKADGPNHGHYVLNRDKVLVYKRDPYQPNGAHNYTSWVDSPQQADRTN